MGFWRGLAIVFAVGFVASGVGCTSILGNFSSADSVAKEAGTGFGRHDGSGRR